MVAVDAKRRKPRAARRSDGENFFRSADVDPQRQEEPKYPRLVQEPSRRRLRRSATLLSRKTEIATTQTPLVVMSGR